MKSIAQLQEERFDLNLQQALHELAEEDGAALLEESATLNEDESVVVSESQTQKVMQALNAEAQRQRRKQRIPLHRKAATMVAAFFGVLLVSFSVLMVSAEAFRLDVYNWVLDFQNGQIDLSASQEGSVALEISEELPYIATYIPERFRLSRCSIFTGFTSYEYKTPDGDWFELKVTQNTASIALDAENADDVSMTTIHGIEAVTIKKDGLLTLAWFEDNLHFVYMGQLSLEESIQIAESVAKQEISR